MAKKGGRNRLKRLSAPKDWDISRKRRRFIIKPLPGPHSIASSYPLGVVLRDLASIVKSKKELVAVLSAGKVLVDGRVRRSMAFPTGLFDEISVPSEGLVLRMLPSPRGLIPVKVSENETGRKLCRISTKTKIEAGHIQYGFHDGKTMVADALKLSPGDSVLMHLPDQKIVSQVKLAKDSLGLVLSGDRAGQVGKIMEVKKGTISKEKMVSVSLPGGDTELPSRLVFPVGMQSPLINVEVQRR